MAERLKHIFLEESGEASRFTSPIRGRSASDPIQRNREFHSAKLRRSLDKVWQFAKEVSRERTAISLPAKKGTYLEFEGVSGSDLITKSLENRPKGIRLLNVRTVPTQQDSESTKTYATIYIPEGKESHFIEIFRQYAEDDTDSSKPKNKRLVESIEDVRLAILESFWQDEQELKPNESSVWCEIWLRGDTPETVESFRSIADNLNITLQREVLRFPERTIILAKANRMQLMELMESSGELAEFRRAKETARFFLELNNKEQTNWVKDLRARLDILPNSNVAVTILDSGVNNGHLLLEPLLQDEDCHTVEPDWNASDHHGHGTWMSGIAAYGDLLSALESKSKVVIRHCLESVKILPPVGENDPKLYGNLTIQGVSRAEIQAPNRDHIACMAIAAKDGRDRGRPSSWSAAIDKLTSGFDDGTRRLFIVAAGNVDPSDWNDYPNSNQTHSIHDPGQSWNALTVGGFTEKIRVTDPLLAGYELLAPAGGLSPFSSTSWTWETKKWPIKPDIVLESGNMAKSPNGFIQDNDDLAILTTGHQPQSRQLYLLSMTSAATAQAAWMAAQIKATYPNAWPETIRGLLVHSADWTDSMKNQFLSSEDKTDYGSLLRICGYGVPNLNRALNCYQNNLTLIAQEEIQPFDRKFDKDSRPVGYQTKEMHLHELPWPKEVLLALGETPVTLRITLSYFIEPSPGEIGWKDRYRYASHTLRFDLNNANEDRTAFIRRINAAAREDGEHHSLSSGSRRWVIGSNNRHLGSIHSDIWNNGTAAELATCNLVGIYPVIGWWRERPWLDRWNHKTRYSLIVSINTPEMEVDIYTPVANMVRIPVTVVGQ